MKKLTKEFLMLDILTLEKNAKEQGYLLGTRDIFALGYMCGKYGIDRLIGNEEAVEKACGEYDKTDDLALLDTISETLADLNVIDE